MNKKLQVFISSTYTDLIDERQAAVEAILDAGHIPAGMELFKAGNDSQLKTIYKWIDESDVYMLILGGRYGTLEPKSNKSYTQLEYEYAISKKIPVFAVVLSSSFLTQKINAISLKEVTEQSEPNKYQKFKSLVMSKIVREVDDCKDIKITIHSTLNEFINSYDLVGWVRNNNENDTIQLLKDNNLLIKENNSLNKQICKLQEQLKSASKEQLGAYSFDELVSLFKKKEFKIPSNFLGVEEDKYVNALDVFIVLFDTFVTGITNQASSKDIDIHIYYNIAPYFMSFNILESAKLPKTTAQRIQTTKIGLSFYSMLESKGYIKK